MTDLPESADEDGRKRKPLRELHLSAPKGLISDFFEGLPDNAKSPDVLDSRTKNAKSSKKTAQKGKEAAEGAGLMMSPGSKRLRSRKQAFPRSSNDDASDIVSPQELRASRRTQEARKSAQALTPAVEFEAPKTRARTSKLLSSPPPQSLAQTLGKRKSTRATEHAGETRAIGSDVENDEDFDVKPETASKAERQLRSAGPVLEEEAEETQDGEPLSHRMKRSKRTNVAPLAGIKGLSSPKLPPRPAHRLPQKSNADGTDFIALPNSDDSQDTGNLIQTRRRSKRNGNRSLVEAPVEASRSLENNTEIATNEAQGTPETVPGQSEIIADEEDTLTDVQQGVQGPKKEAKPKLEVPIGVFLEHKKGRLDGRYYFSQHCIETKFNKEPTIVGPTGFLRIANVSGAWQSQIFVKGVEGEDKLTLSAWLESACQICNRPTDADQMILCDGCEKGYHMTCLNPPLTSIPSGDWYCSGCEQDGSHAKVKYLQ